MKTERKFRTCFTVCVIEWRKKITEVEDKIIGELEVKFREGENRLQTVLNEVRAAIDDKNKNCKDTSKGKN